MTSVSLKELLKSKLALVRSGADVLRQNLAPIANGDVLGVDFNEIQALSRAFAHSLILLQEEFGRKGVSLRWINTSEDVQRMLDVVLASRAEPRDHFRPDLVAVDASIEEASEDFQN